MGVGSHFTMWVLGIELGTSCLALPTEPSPSYLSSSATKLFISGYKVGEANLV